MLLRFFFFLVFSLSTFAWGQMAPPATIDSLDAKVVNSRTVAVGRVTEFKPQDPANPYENFDITFRVESTIKGKPRSEWRTFQRYQRGPYNEWLDARTRILLFEPFDPKDEFWLREIPLDARPLAVSRADFSVLRTPDAVLQAARALARDRAGPLPMFVLPVPPGPLGERWMKEIGMTHVGGLRVPANRSLERQAHRWIRSRDPDVRLNGANALRLFPSKSNRERLLRLTLDPSIHVVVNAEQNHGIEEFYYPVRDAVDRALSDWDDRQSPDMRLHRRDRLAELTRLDVYGTDRESDFAWLDRAKRLGDLTLYSGPSLTDAQVGAISRRRGLTNLRAPHSGLTTAQLKVLLSLTNLRTLDLSGNPLDDAAVPLLAQFPRLQELSLQGTQITPEALANLRRDRPSLKITTSG